MFIWIWPRSDEKGAEKNEFEFSKMNLNFFAAMRLPFCHIIAVKSMHG